MINIILNFPKQFKVGLQLAEKLNIESFSETQFKGIAVLGMGGSSIAGELLKLFFREKKIKIPLIIGRNYDLPFDIKNNYLVFSVSYSGNTEETISAFNQALEKKLKIIAISSNGKLEKIAKKNKICFIKLPKGLPPRLAIGYQFFILLKILLKLKIISFKMESIKNLERGIKIKELEKQGRKLAEKLKNKIILIYSSERYKELARNWKIQFNENSKVPSFYNFFPELNHNEINGFFSLPSLKLGNFHLIILNFKNEDKKILKRMKITSKMLKEKGISCSFIKIKGEKILEKIFNSLILASFTSYYLAKKTGVDPLKVEMIEEFKKRI